MGVTVQRLKLLAAPFGPEELEWRVGRVGQGARGPWAQVVARATSRAVLDRFDAVCGPENWSNRFRAGPGGAVICRIAVHVEGAGWVGKEGGASDGDAGEGGLASGMRRAAVQWGCGRYLCGMEEGLALVHEYGLHTAEWGDERFRWNPPALPDWALPADEPTHAELLAFVKAHYRRAEARARLGEAWVRIPEFVVAQAELLKKDYYLARQVARELAQLVGVTLARRAA